MTIWKKHAKVGRHLVALTFLAGYVLMALVIWYQGQTIMLQRDAIHDLHQDGLDLAALRLHQAASSHKH